MSGTFRGASELSGITAALTLAAACICAAPATAANYGEAANGDISGDRSNPTQLTLQAGSNLVTGTFGQSSVPNVRDLDYLRVTVPQGFVLQGVVLAALNQGGANSFIGVQAGPVFTRAPGEVAEQDLLGWHHIFTYEIGTNILPGMGLGPGATGFTPPLPAGDYTFWIYETNTEAEWSYGFDFQLAAVAQQNLPLDRPPALAVLALLLSALGAWAVPHWRRAREAGEVARATSGAPMVRQGCAQRRE